MKAVMVAARPKATAIVLSEETKTITISFFAAIFNLGGMGLEEDATHASLYGIS